MLLEASHKRAAALTEIQALKTEGGIGADPRIEVRAFDYLAIIYRVFFLTGPPLNLLSVGR